ncbi:MAG: DUF4872 domain-containing protein [Pseudoclavibacter sp.]|nr:DUF4872 domain-containing protein [Pseudoclavibacter sp.]
MSPASTTGPARAPAHAPHPVIAPAEAILRALGVRLEPAEIVVMAAAVRYADPLGRDPDGFGGLDAAFSLFTAAGFDCDLFQGRDPELFLRLARRQERLGRERWRPTPLYALLPEPGPEDGEPVLRPVALSGLDEPAVRVRSASGQRLLAPAELASAAGGCFAAPALTPRALISFAQSEPRARLRRALRVLLSRMARARDGIARLESLLADRPGPAALRAYRRRTARLAGGDAAVHRGLLHQALEAADDPALPTAVPAGFARSAGLHAAFLAGDDAALTEIARVERAALQRAHDPAAASPGPPGAAPSRERPIAPRRGWPAPYRRGSHCFSTMLANAFVDTGLELDEELVHLLGGGLGFLFHREGGRCYVNARSQGMEHLFARRIGARIELSAHLDARDMLRRLAQWTRRGRLSYLYCEAKELSLFREVLPWGEVHAFTEHALPVRSVQADGSVLASEYLWREPVRIPQAEIAAAAAMPNDGAPRLAAPARRFTIAAVLPPERVPDLRDTLVQAMAENAERFLRPASNVQGERAVRALHRELRAMAQERPAALRRELRSVSTTLERLGTGGGAGRRLLSRGLRTAAERLGGGELGRIARDYARLGSRWRALARDMRRRAEAPDPREDWAELSRAAGRIAQGERRAAEALLHAAERLTGAGG